MGIDNPYFQMKRLARWVYVAGYRSLGLNYNYAIPSRQSTIFATPYVRHRQDVLRIEAVHLELDHVIPSQDRYACIHHRASKFLPEEPHLDGLSS
jgi:hypothetical protein